MVQTGATYHLHDVIGQHIVHKPPTLVQSAPGLGRPPLASLIDEGDDNLHQWETPVKVLQVLPHHINDERLTLVAKVIAPAMDEQDIRCVSSSGVQIVGKYTREMPYPTHPPLTKPTHLSPTQAQVQEIGLSGPCLCPVDVRVAQDPHQL